jgi:uncharacterized tellurite resistance protein B-like protein
MLDSLKSFLKDLAGGTAEPQHFEAGDYRVAAAALLIHLINADGEFNAAERTRLHEVLKANFSLDDTAAQELVAAAVLVEGEAVDFYRFTSLLNRALDEEGRQRVVEMMWELVYADGRADELEDNLIWRVADLLHVPSRDRIALRRKVALGADAATSEPDRN